MSLFERLLRRLDLEKTDTDTYLGGAGAAAAPAEDRLFGGLVAAQASVAAARSAGDTPLHSLHAYFLRPGRPDAEITFRVTRSKEGRNFKVRSVEAWQRAQLIFTLQASFTHPVKGVAHQSPMPAAPQPEEAPNRDALRGRSNWTEMPLDVRMATEITGNRPLPPEQRIWLKANGALPADPVLHMALVVYASDRTLLDTAWRPHADAGPLAGASLDHSMWFHAEPQFDDWHLYAMESPAASAGRGLAIGGIYCRDGTRVVTVAQEGVLRTAPPKR